MIFIWSSNGGPLQYVGLLLFLLQFLPVLQLHYNVTQSHLFILSFILMASGLAIGWYSGSLTRLVNAASTHIEDARNFIQRTTGITGTAKILCLLLGCFVTVAVSSYFGGPEMVIFPLHIIAALLLIKGALADERDAHEQGRRNDEASREAKMAEIVQIVQNMPIEEFVPRDDVDSECSVSQLKKMLDVRGKQVKDGECLERRDLVEAVKGCRNFSETCCICCEDYNKGDPLRILPKCRHEFHLECLDQW
eukprot:CAMPEP_0185739452 /NCGR_PEP_ID=MMETSP1171-20130828/35476_1 /TAXON_ID=374046 /ORGANISM="Helicotheca tamensis, Strain CCMP826" /LENGTH=249 /DNA_ID=CAMNT_0028411029 /DNA_START=88 /DNA_END=834 /DNA_ORIENTATION=-